METITLASRNGASTAVDASSIKDLTAAVRGTVYTPSSSGYDEARTIWNGMIDRRPGVIVECANTEDICQAVKFAKAHGLLVAVRGGGHNIAGKAVCEGGLMISLAKMNHVTVDPNAQTAVVQPGATLGEFDAACQVYGLATPTGINSTTGIAGLTLGGGFGWLSRTYGLTIDNLASALVVTADGDVVGASETENPDLFWGIRGGGGNFGIVSSFTFRLHKVGPEVLSGLIIHPFEDAKAVLQEYRVFCEQAPDEATVWVVMRQAPPLPFIPEEYHGKEVLVLAAIYSGDMATGEQVFTPLRAIGRPIADVIGPHPFTGWQAAFDPLLTPGVRNYWKSHDFNGLEDGFIDALIDAVGKLPCGHCEIALAQMGGATSRVAPGATAYRDRNVKFIMNVHGRWETAAEDENCIQWCRNIFNAATPFSTGGVYVNFLTEEESSRVPGAYGESYQRLIDLKRKYDPTNLFCMNQNIDPA